MAFTDDYTSETTKGAVHLAAALLCGSMALYNGLAHHRRLTASSTKRHLAQNAFLYTCGTIWELLQVKSHLQKI